MNIHVITAFYRIHLAKTLIHCLEEFLIHWHPIYSEKEFYPFNKFWIHPLLVKELLPTDYAYRKLNDFIETQEIIDDDYYSFMGDDDMFEPGFFDKIREICKTEKSEIIFYSVARGNTTPACDVAQHPCHPLIPNSLNDIRVCNVGLQFILKGNILKQVKFNNTHIWDDGILAEHLKNKFGSKIKFAPDLFVLGNYFQPGRYTDNSALLKSTWKLPEII